MAEAPRIRRTYRCSAGRAIQKRAHGMSTQTDRVTKNGRKKRARAQLRLGLKPILPTRTAEVDGHGVSHGFSLRLPGGPQLLAEDPLLRAFGVKVVELQEFDPHDAFSQREVFDPGNVLELEQDRSVV